MTVMSCSWCRASTTVEPTWPAPITKILMPAERLAGHGVGPFRIGIDADSLGDPVDVVEERDHLDRVVDARVAQAVASKAVDVRRRDRAGLVRQLDGKVAQRANPRLDVR